MKRSNQILLAGTLAGLALGALLIYIYEDWKDNGWFDNSVFRNQEDELERMTIKSRENKDKSQTGLLSGFGEDRMDDDGTVNVSAHIPPHLREKSDFEIPSSSSTHS